MKNPIRAFVDKVIDQRLMKVAESDIRVRALLERRGYADSEPEYSTELREEFLMTYEKYVWVYAAVYAIASSGAKVPFKIYHLKRNEQRGDEVLDGPVWNLFNRPNPFQSAYDFQEAVLSSMELSGNAFIEKGGADMKLPVQMYLLRPDWVKVLPSAKTLVAGYEYNVNGSYIKFTPEQICHIKYFHPRSELYGMSPIQAGSNSLVLDFYTMKYQKNFFKQGAMMNTYVTVPKALGEKEFQRFKEQLRADYAGVDRAHMIGVFDNDAELKELGTDPQKFLLDKQRGMNRDEVLATFGVPPVMVGLLDSATFNNTQEQKKAFWENTMTPKLIKLANKFNQEILWPLELEGEFDLSGIQALQEDADRKAGVATRLVAGSIYTPNEARKEFYNKEPIEGGDTIKPINPPEQPLFGSALPVAKSAGTRIEKAKKEFVTAYGKYIGEYDRAMRKSFKAMSDKVVSTIKASFPKSGIKKNDLVNEAFNGLDEETVAMMEELAALHEDVQMDMVSEKYRDVKGTSIPRTIKSKSRKQAASNAHDWADKSSDSIVDTMQDRVARFMDKAMAEDMAIDDVTAGVREIFEGTERDAFPWARAIARTETGRAVNAGKLEGMKASGIMFKEWIAADGPNGRPEHTALGEVGPVPIDYVYKTDASELRYPGDPDADVSDLVNCRCTITESLEGPQEDEE